MKNRINKNIITITAIAFVIALPGYSQSDSTDILSAINQLPINERIAIKKAWIETTLHRKREERKKLLNSTAAYTLDVEQLTNKVALTLKKITSKKKQSSKLQQKSKNFVGSAGSLYYRQSMQLTSSASRLEKTTLPELRTKLRDAKSFSSWFNAEIDKEVLKLDEEISNLERELLIVGLQEIKSNPLLGKGKIRNLIETDYSVESGSLIVIESSGVNGESQSNPYAPAP